MLRAIKLYSLKGKRLWKRIEVRAPILKIGAFSIERYVFTKRASLNNN